MSSRYSIAQRTPLLNTLFAGIACAATLALTAGPAMAAPGDLDRVEISGRVVEAPLRYDVRASCQSAEAQLQANLGKTWARERSYAADDLRAALAAFLRFRAEHLAALEALRPEQWEREGRHSAHGPVTILNHTLHSAWHDAVHVAQIARQLHSE